MLVKDFDTFLTNHFAGDGCFVVPVALKQDGHMPSTPSAMVWYFKSVVQMCICSLYHSSGNLIQVTHRMALL